MKISKDLYAFVEICIALPSQTKYQRRLSRILYRWENVDVFGHSV